MDKNNFHDKKSYSENFSEELAYDLKRVFSKYFKSFNLVLLAVTITIAVITSIMNFDNKTDEMKGFDDNAE